MRKSITGLGILCLLAGPVTSFASKGGGNGGFVYRCGETIELMDLKEVAHLPNLRDRVRISRENLSYEQQMEKRIALLRSVNEDLAAQVHASIKAIGKKLEIRRAIDTGVPDDLGSYPQIPGCDLTNVIEYSAAVLVNGDLFSKLPDFDRAALMFHEALYEMARNVNWSYYKDLRTSLPVRRMVAMLFAENFEEVREDLKALTDYYLVPFSREIGKEVSFKVCLDKKYFGQREDLVSLGPKYFKKLKLIFRQSALRRFDWYTVSYLTDLSAYMKGRNSGDVFFYHGLVLKQTEVMRGKDFKLVQHRCDGSQGESFVAQTESFQADHPNVIDVEYKTKKVDFGNEKELDGSMTITMIDHSDLSGKDHFIRRLEGTYQKEALIDQNRQFIGNFKVTTKSRPLPEALIDLLK